MSSRKTIFDNSVDQDTMGNRILRAREISGLTTGELSRQLGVKKSTVESWESDRSEPRAHLAMRVAGLLGVTPTWLFGGVGEAPEDDMISPEIRVLRQQLAKIKEMRDKTSNAISAMEQALDELVRLQSQKS